MLLISLCERNAVITSSNFESHMLKTRETQVRTQQRCIEERTRARASDLFLEAGEVNLQLK